VASIDYSKCLWRKDDASFSLFLYQQVRLRLRSIYNYGQGFSTSVGLTFFVGNKPLVLGSASESDRRLLASIEDDEEAVVDLAGLILELRSKTFNGALAEAPENGTGSLSFGKHCP
jgi:hypothetical protein